MTPTVCVLAAMNYGLATQCRYVPMPDRYVGIYTADAMLLGKLTADGEFKERTRFSTNDDVLVIYSCPQYTLLNNSGVVARPVVYNLHGKQLTPGRVSQEGAFIADPKGKVLPFAEYEYSPTAPPIWNLPGRFLPLGIDPDARPLGLGAKGDGISSQTPKLGATRAGFGGGSWTPLAAVGGGGGGRGGLSPRGG